MRSIRTKRRHAGRPTPAQAAALLAFVLLVAYLAAATSVGNFIAESIVAPIFTALGSAQSEASEEEGSVQAGLALDPAAPEATAQAELSTEGFHCYALQLGAFSNEENAESFAREVQGRPQGGRVYQDGDLFRVFSGIFLTKEEARAEKERLLLSAGIDSSIYEFNIPALSLRVTASASQLDAVLKGFSVLSGLCTELAELADGSAADLAAAAETLAARAGECRSLAGSLSGASGTAGQLSGALLDAAACLDEAGSTARSENKVEFSAALKYTYIVVVCSCAELAGAIAA